MSKTRGVAQFELGGLRSYDDFNMVITEPPTLSIPERERTFESIPGRSGDLCIDKGRYKNLTVSYKVAILAEAGELSEEIGRIAGWLSGSEGYQRLTDGYDPEHFRLAALSGTPSFARKAETIGIGTVKFNCKPFRYRLDGDRATVLTGSGRIFNPTTLDAAPKIAIAGSGNITLKIGGAEFLLEGVSEEIVIDSESFTASQGGQSAGDKLKFFDFPILKPGYNQISTTGSVSKVTILPRWRDL